MLLRGIAPRHLPNTLCRRGFIAAAAVCVLAAPLAAQSTPQATPQATSPVMQPVSQAARAPQSTGAAADRAVTPILPSFVSPVHSLSFAGVRLGDVGEEPNAPSDGRLLPTAASPDLPDPAAPPVIEMQDRGKVVPAVTPDNKTVASKGLVVAPVPPSGPPVNEPIPDVIEAKNLFGKVKKGAPLAARAIGSYSRGCLAGGQRLANDGPAWQAMRLSRNRHWGHPKLVALVKDLAVKAQKLDHWPGILVGDLSQPRGGPMLSGHASHQIGLDADVWLTPMPKKRLTRREREQISATSMLDDTWLAVDPEVFTDKHVALIKRAASYPQVERLFVHPAIKKALCERAGDDRQWLGKVRPIYGHYYHFHIRIGCPDATAGCEHQKPPPANDDFGCGKEVEQWLARVRPAVGPQTRKSTKSRPAAPVTMARLPDMCTEVLEAGPDGVKAPKPPVKTRLVPIAEPSPTYADRALDTPDKAPRPAHGSARGNAGGSARKSAQAKR